MAVQKSFPWWAVVLAIGCVGVLCIGILLVAGGGVYLLNLRSDPKAESEAVIISPAETLGPTPSPTPGLEPPLVEPAYSPTPEIVQDQPTLALTGNQRLEEYSLFDDFSSEALGWPVYEDGKTILKYENQAYSIQVLEPDYYDWAFIPVGFVPFEIWFDVQGSLGAQDGTFGVFCQFLNDDNYAYVEFDLADNSYVIGQIIAGESIPLTAENDSGQYWYSTDALQSSPNAVNRIGVSCYPQSITLFVNDQWVDEVEITQSFDRPGEAAFFVYTFDFAGEEGYKVIFDNVEVYQPVQ